VKKEYRYEQEIGGFGWNDVVLNFDDAVAEE